MSDLHSTSLTLVCLWQDLPEAERKNTLQRFRGMTAHLADKTRKLYVDKVKGIELPPVQVEVRLKRDPKKVSCGFPLPARVDKRGSNSF